jgi:hypothetical protein
MNRSTLLRAGTLLTSLGAAPLALAQEGVTNLPKGLAFAAVMGGLGMLMVVAIIAVVSLNENRKNRDKLALVEKLVTSGQPVPRELMTNEPMRLPLPEERRRDVRRGITLLCWAIAVAAIPIIGSGGQWRYGVWGLLFLLPSLGSFFKAHLTAREIARGASNGSLRT